MRGWKIIVLRFEHSAAAIDQPKTARMEQRTKAHVKEHIQYAATLMGVDETTFVTSVAYERARKTIEDHERTVLAPEDRASFLAHIDAPALTTDALQVAVKRHREIVRRGARAGRQFHR